MAKKGAKPKKKVLKIKSEAPSPESKSVVDIATTESTMRPAQSRSTRLMVPAQSRSARLVVPEDGEGVASGRTSRTSRGKLTPTLSIAKSREGMKSWTSSRNLMQTSSQLLSFESITTLSSTSLITEVPSKKPSEVKPKKKKTGAGKKPEDKKGGKERKEKKEPIPILVVSEKKPRPLPTIADEPPSITTILAVAKRMREAEETRRAKDEATMKAFLEAEAEREAAKLAALAPPGAPGKKGKGKRGKEKKEGEPPAKKAKEGKEKGKKEKKKKLTKQERQKLEAERAEQARIEAEEAAVRAAEEERLARIAEMKALREKEKRENLEHGFRCEQLQNTCTRINSLISFNFELAMEEKRQREWDQYLKCDGLPDPASCPQMNTYLHLWDKKILDTHIKDAATKTREVIKLLEVLNDLIDDAFAVNDKQMAEWKWVRLLFRQHQQLSLDTATYRMLRNVDTKLHRIDIPTADFHYKDEHLIMYIWLRVQLATPLPNPRRPPKPTIEINFPDMNMNVCFPETLTCEMMAIRGMYVTYDHLSDLSRSFDKPGGLPKHYHDDLFTVTLKEWNDKLSYKSEAVIKMQQEAEENKAADNVETKTDNVSIYSAAPGVYKLDPSPSSYVIAVEEIMYNNLRDIAKAKTDTGEVNLRKYVILGGVYHLELFQQPAQPQGLVLFEITITALQLPKCLKEVPYHVQYNPPVTFEGSVRKLPEEIEEEMKKQEEELEKLMLVTLTLPTHVMWLDNPVVCHWDRDKQYWSTTDIHDLKHIEEKGYVTFRTGCFGCFAVGVSRYTNLPFQAWELKPEADGTVTLQLTAAVLLIDFNVKGNTICIAQLQGNPNNILHNIVGVYHKLPKLRRLMRSCGADLFPEFDAFCYTEGTCEKHWPMERHLYYNVAQMSGCFNFAWSRWNLLAGRRRIVMQMREFRPQKVKQAPHAMVMVTPLKALYVDCTEVSQVFNEEGIEGMKFYADLYHLMKGTSDMATKKKVKSALPEQVNAIADLLCATRILSFS